MATQLFLRSGAAAIQRGTNTNNLRATAVGWWAYLLSSTRGTPASSIAGTPTVAGPTAGVEVTPGGSPPAEFISAPLDADITISGTVTLNLRCSESNMNANAAINCYCDRLDSTGAVISRVFTTARVTEMAVTTETAVNFTVTPTSTNFLKGDRIRIVVFADDAGTMGTGFTFTLWYNGPTAAASGDTYVTFTENFGFLATAPAGTQMFLTDTAGPAVGADVEKEMWTARGSGVVSIIRNTAAGWTAPLQWTDSAGGTAIEWYSKRLNAFTLTGLVRLNLRARASLADTTSIRGEIAVVNSDGSGAVVWAANDLNNFGAPSAGALDTVETASVIDIAGDDLAVTAGQRLRFRVYIDDMSTAPIVTGRTATFFYAGTSAAASGDSYVTLTQTVTEFAETYVPRNPGVDYGALAVM